VKIDLVASIYERVYRGIDKQLMFAY